MVINSVDELVERISNEIKDLIQTYKEHNISFAQKDNDILFLKEEQEVKLFYEYLLEKNVFCSKELAYDEFKELFYVTVGEDKYLQRLSENGIQNLKRLLNQLHAKHIKERAKNKREDIETTKVRDSLKDFTVKELVDELLSRNGVYQDIVKENEQKIFELYGKQLVLHVTNYPNTESYCVLN